eukprot:14479655-Alexandrium_andersonii.AAC.1
MHCCVDAKASTVISDKGTEKQNPCNTHHITKESIDPRSAARHGRGAGGAHHRPAAPRVAVNGSGHTGNGGGDGTC